MTVYFKTRVKKLTEDDIILEAPDPTNEAATWTWRNKGFRAADIMGVEMLDKASTIVTIWDYTLDRPKRLVVKEPFEDVMLKWEVAESNPVIFEPDDTEEGDNPDEEED